MKLGTSVVSRETMNYWNKRKLEILKDCLYFMFKAIFFLFYVQSVIMRVLTNFECLLQSEM